MKLKQALLVMGILAVVGGCQPLNDNTVRVDIPVEANTASRIVVVYERNGGTWQQRSVLPADVAPIVTPQPAPVPPVIATPPPPPQPVQSQQSGCDLFVMPDVGVTPPIPVIPNRNEMDDKKLDVISYGYIGVLRQYISGMKKQLKDDYTKYLEACNKSRK